MAKLMAIFVLALAVTATAEAGGEIRKKLLNKFLHPKQHLKASFGPRGGDSSASAAAAATGQGSASASAAATSSRPAGHHYAPAPAPVPRARYQYARPHAPEVHSYKPAYTNYAEDESSSAASAASSAGRGGASSAAAVSANRKTGGSRHNVGSAPAYALPTFGSQYADSAATAAAAAAAAKTEQHKVPAYHGHHIPERYGAQAVYKEHVPAHHVEGPNSNAYSWSSTTENGSPDSESSYYKKLAEQEIHHEDGKLDDDHYLKANSYAKAHDESLRMNHGNDNTDYEITPTTFKSKQRKNHFVMDYSKTGSDSGSSVLSHDRRTQAYNRDFKKLREQVDMGQTRTAGGLSESYGLTGGSYDEESENEYHDSNGVNPADHSAAAAAAAAAATGKYGSSSASTASTSRT